MCFFHSSTHSLKISGKNRLVAIFISSNVNIMAKNDYGETALHEASINGHSDVAKLLVDNSDKIINEKNHLKQTALHLAVISGHLEVVKILIEKNANAEILDSKYKSPLYYAIQLDRFEIVIHLIENGATINSKRKNKFKPLYIAARKGDIVLAKYFVEKGADVNAKITKYQQTALHEATGKGHLTFVQFLIEQADAHIGIKDKEGVTALHMACTQGHFEIVQYLVNKKAPIRAKDKEGNIPLHRAILGRDDKLDETATRRSIDIIQFFLEKNKSLIEEKNNGGNTALLLALKKGKLGFVEFLLENGANIKAKDKDLNNVAHIAFQRGLREYLKQFLESKNLKIDEKNAAGKSLLHLAIEEYDLQMATLLLSHGANFVVRDSDENTPLHLAARTGQTELIRNLIQKKGKKIAKFLNEMNEDGNTPLHLAVIGEHFGAVQALVDRGANVLDRNCAGDDVMLLSAKTGNVEMVQFFSTKGLSIQTFNLEYLSNPIHLASGAGHLALVQHLLSWGASLVIGDVNGDTPLHRAASTGKLEVVKELLNEGALVDFKNRVKETALHLAIEGNHLKTVECLVERGANIEAVDIFGQTALHWAGRNGNYLIYQFLISKNANQEAEDVNGEKPSMANHYFASSS